MEDDHIFIDKIIKNSLKDYGEQPNTSWEKMEMYLDRKGVLSETSEGSGFLKLKNIKTKIAIISGVLILISGYYFLNETEDKEVFSKEIIENISDTTSKHVKTECVPEIGKENKETDSLAKELNEIKKKDETKIVKVRVEVPVHKNVIIKKQIIMKDTLN